jgi:hypothetical protein
MLFGPLRRPLKASVGTGAAIVGQPFKVDLPAQAMSAHLAHL